jgi:LuxR family maltose regulon positive regulatory protein
MARQLTLISAPAGFGKTTLLSEWIATCGRPTAWVSLDHEDNDPTRFLIYLIAALRTILPTVGAEAWAGLQSPQPPPIHLVLTSLLNELVVLPEHVALVFDDYHVIEAPQIQQAIAFLLEHLPAHLHLIIATREDPDLPLARLRARNQLTELRAADLRFTLPEATGFLNHIMGLNLSVEAITALETRTEGWVAGLQLAALSIRGQDDTASFIASFTGSHRFVIDYLVEEVLQQQPTHIQHFLLHTALLGRLCAQLCDTMLPDLAFPGQTLLEYLEDANLFLIPLDNQRRWYRYHHLFAEMLRQRLLQQTNAADLATFHIRASTWFEQNGLWLEAFQHAAAANDIDRAERLIGEEGMPIHFRGTVTTILGWLGSLPTAVLNARPALWWRYGAMLLVNGHPTGVEEKLQAAEDALNQLEENAKNRNLHGRIATGRATLALTRYRPDVMLTESRRALEYLDPNNLQTRSTALWTLGLGFFLSGNRRAAREAQLESIALSQTVGATFTTILATSELGRIQEGDNQLTLAAETYQQVLRLASEQPLQIIYEAHLGLARIYYEWNELATAEQHTQRALYFARQYDPSIDRFVHCEVFLARLKQAQGAHAEAEIILAQAWQTTQQRAFVHRIPEVVAAQVWLLLRQGNVTAAAQLIQNHELPLSRARVSLAEGDATAALTLLEPLGRHAEAQGWADEQLKIMILKIRALQLLGENEAALQLLRTALTIGEASGFIRSFVDEGQPFAELVAQIVARGGLPEYTKRLLAAFAAKQPGDTTPTSRVQPLIEPLSERELAILRLIADGLSNEAIGKKLFLALNTVKGHNQRIFAKLGVQRRTEAVARARELGLL